MKLTRLSAWFTAVMLSGYLLGIHRGHMALWDENDPQPIRIFSCNIYTLPREVQQALEKGIRIETEADLQRILENYLS